MKIFAAGASGATGKHAVGQLLDRGVEVKALIRESANLPDELVNHAGLTILRGNILEIPEQELREHLKDCDGALSCLGHNLTFKGLFTPPRKLVRDAVRRICLALPGLAVSGGGTVVGKSMLTQGGTAADVRKFVLMNTSGNVNHQLNEKVSFGEKIVLSILRALLPPHSDNEQAAGFLQTELGQLRSDIEWVAVRPDGLTDEEQVSEYTLHPSPVRSALFNAGKTSRINVGHLMAELLTNPGLWAEWKGEMPVVYNRDSSN